MKASDRCIELIREHEGFRPHAYLCPAGVWTIGWGHTAGVKPGDVITREKGEAFLKSDIANAEKPVVEQGLDFNQNQFDALVSFVFNFGGPKFRTSTLLKRIREDINDTRIRYEFSRWVYAKGKIEPGLVKRRKVEADLYFSK